MNRFTWYLLFVLFTGCPVTPAGHRDALHSTKEREMTVGLVQKEIRVGMDQAAVAERLGSPNIVSRDSEGREVWIFDRIATEASISKSGVGGIAGGGGAKDTGETLLLGILGVSGSYESGARVTTQKTLTVIIRFDDHGRVSSFSYHSSKF